MNFEPLICYFPFEPSRICTSYVVLMAGQFIKTAIITMQNTGFLLLMCVTRITESLISGITAKPPLFRRLFSLIPLDYLMIPHGEDVFSYHGRQDKYRCPVYKAGA